MCIHCSSTDSHCLTLDYDAKSSKAFDSTMTLKPVPCNGVKKFLCEQKGINLNINGEFLYHDNTLKILYILKFVLKLPSVSMKRNNNFLSSF